MAAQSETDGIRRPVRADFVSEVLRVDEATRVVTMRMLPDPRRYQEIKRDGQTLYLDKYLGYAFSLEDLAAGNWNGLPCYSLSPSIEHSGDYAAARQSALEEEVDSGTYVPPDETARGHRNLEIDTEQRGVGFLSVDICGSTAMRKRDPVAFDRAFALFTRELGTVVGQFNGSILKMKGDGFIAFIDHPSFTRLCDNLVDLGLTLLVVLHGSINPALANMGIDPLHVRVGADYGEAVIKKITIPATGYETTEVASDALSRAVKIEEACAPNEFWIGRDLYELVHVGWLERGAQVEFDGNLVGLPGYPVYRMQ
jgi:class 3 adenylate cyclase